MYVKLLNLQYSELIVGDFQTTNENLPAYFKTFQSANTILREINLK